MPEPSFPKPPPPNIVWHHGITRADRFRALHSVGATLWFTGLSGSGKSTIAVALERRLVEAGRFCYRLDGDNVRHGLNANLGFSHADRAENIRRVGEVARLFADAGCVALSSFISPYRVDRAAVRGLHAAPMGGSEGTKEGLLFLEIYVNTPIEICERRDPKGLYKKARAGELTHFTGIDDPYEVPESPELTLSTATMSVDESVEACVGLLKARGVLPK